MKELETLRDKMQSEALKAKVRRLRYTQKNDERRRLFFRGKEIGFHNCIAQIDLLLQNQKELDTLATNLQAEGFKTKMEKLVAMAKKYGFILLSTDSKTYRVSFKDDLSTLRIDIYTIRMTVGINRFGQQPKFLRGQDYAAIENIFKNPYY